jgi:hypothetical protein
MAAARRPPKDPLMAAAEKKMAYKGQRRDINVARRGETYQADTQLRTLVPAAEVVVDAGKQTGLCETEEPAGGHETGPVVDKAHKGHVDAPEHHDGGDEARRPQPLEQDVGKGFKHRVRHEEDGERGVELRCREAQVVAETGDLGVADVGSVEEGEEIEYREPWDERHVQLPH